MAYLAKVGEIDIDRAYSKNTPCRLLGTGIQQRGRRRPGGGR